MIQLVQPQVQLPTECVKQSKGSQCSPKPLDGPVASGSQKGQNFWKVEGIPPPSVENYKDIKTALCVCCACVQLHLIQCEVFLTHD